jgi:hypothetical protein
VVWDVIEVEPQQQFDINCELGDNINLRNARNPRVESYTPAWHTAVSMTTNPPAPPKAIISWPGYGIMFFWQLGEFVASKAAADTVAACNLWPASLLAAAALHASPCILAAAAILPCLLGRLAPLLHNLVHCLFLQASCSTCRKRMTWRSVPW